MSATADVKEAAHKAASSQWTEGLARAGLVAKGLTYCIVAAIAINVAVGGGGELENRPGALHEVAESSLGQLLLAALAVGLAGYAIWRFARALLGRTLETGEREGALKRIGIAARGALYAWLAFVCAELASDADQAAGKGKDEKGTDGENPRMAARQVDRRSSGPGCNRRRPLQPLPRAVAQVSDRPEGGADGR